MISDSFELHSICMKYPIRTRFYEFHIFFWQNTKAFMVLVLSMSWWRTRALHTFWPFTNRATPRVSRIEPALKVSQLKTFLRSSFVGQRTASVVVLTHPKPWCWRQPLGMKGITQGIMHSRSLISWIAWYMSYIDYISNEIWLAMDALVQLHGPSLIF